MPVETVGKEEGEKKSSIDSWLGFPDFKAQRLNSKSFIKAIFSAPFFEN